MVMTTFLPEVLQNQPTSDEELNELIAETRQKTGENWQLIEHKETRKRRFRKDRIVVWYELMIEVGGMAPFQVLMCVSTAREAKCYLYGLLSGLRKEHH